MTQGTVIMRAEGMGPPQRFRLTGRKPARQHPEGNSSVDTHLGVMEQIAKKEINLLSQDQTS